MSNVYRDCTVTLTDDEKNILKQTIELCQKIASDCNDEDMFEDASTVFSNIYDTYKNGELPTIVHIYE